MEFLMSDFEQMKNNCADDIQLTGKDTTFENILVCIPVKQQ
jgi:hypothetical protein